MKNYRSAIVIFTTLILSGCATYDLTKYVSNDDVSAQIPNFQYRIIDNHIETRLNNLTDNNFPSLYIKTYLKDSSKYESGKIPDEMLNAMFENEKLNEKYNKQYFAINKNSTLYEDALKTGNHLLQLTVPLDSACLVSHLSPKKLASRNIKEASVLLDQADSSRFYFEINKSKYLQNILDFYHNIAQFETETFFEESILDMYRFIQFELEENYIEKARTTDGYLVFTIEDLQWKPNYFPLVISSLTVYTINLFGAPLLSQKITLNCSASVLDSKGDFVKYITVEGQGKAHSAMYWGYSMYGAGVPFSKLFRAAYASAMQDAMNNLKQVLVNDPDIQKLKSGS